MLIGICGTAGSGKSTAALTLMHSAYRFERFSFASPLKSAVAAFFDIPVSWCDSEEKKAQVLPGFNFTLRRALQVIGTEGIRDHLGPDTHILRLHQRVQKIQSEGGPPFSTVIDDVRFRNEAEYVMNNGGIILRIINPIEYANKTVDHASEQFDWLKDVPQNRIFTIENPKSDATKPSSWVEKVQLESLSFFPIAQRAMREHNKRRGTSF